jgi:hypothetical protein
MRQRVAGRAGVAASGFLDQQDPRRVVPELEAVGNDTVDVAVKELHDRGAPPTGAGWRDVGTTRQAVARSALNGRKVSAVERCDRADRQLGRATRAWPVRLVAPTTAFSAIE